MKLDTEKNPLLKPFLKWAGGKTQLLNEIRSNYPKKLGKEIDKYVEPFVGSGAVLFDILNHYELKKIYISDINFELIITYTMIKNEIENLIKFLKKLEEDYLSLNTDDRKLFYYNIREQFNELKILKLKKNNLKIATFFIFLNRTCFNGLYRVNKKGLFNVPMGAYKNPKICDVENLRNISSALKKVEIYCTDYKESKKVIDKHTFVYLDPPYRPLTKTSAFTAYSENSFNDKQQIELAKFIDEINKIGASVILSNSDPKNSDIKDNFFDELYKNYNIGRVEAKRMINSKSSLRGSIKELLIQNY